MSDHCLMSLVVPWLSEAGSSAQAKFGEHGATDPAEFRLRYPDRSGSDRYMDLPGAWGAACISMEGACGDAYVTVHGAGHGAAQTARLRWCSLTILILWWALPQGVPHCGVGQGEAQGDPHGSWYRFFSKPACASHVIKRAPNSPVAASKITRRRITQSPSNKVARFTQKTRANSSLPIWQTICPRECESEGFS
jgi:hypothetical protein